MTTEELRKGYWSIESIEGRKIVWTHRSATQFLGENGVRIQEFDAGSHVFTGPCGRCDNQFDFTVPSRSSAQTLAAKVANGATRCNECYEIDEQERREQQRRLELARQEQERREREEVRERREARRPAMMLKHGGLFTGTECPECDTGFLIVRLNSTSMKPFLSCSSFNPHRHSCDYTQTLASEFHEKYLSIFRERLAAKAGAA